MPGIEARLQRLEDIEAIKELIAKYARLAALGSGDQLYPLFVADGEMDSAGQIMRGWKELSSYFNRLQPEYTIPHLQNFMIDLAGDEAFCRCKMLTPWIGATEGTCGWYEDRLRRQDGAWRFVNRKWTRHRRPLLAQAT